MSSGSIAIRQLSTRGIASLTWTVTNLILLMEYAYIN